MGGFFLVKFLVAIPLLIVVFKHLPHLPSPCERVGGFFSCLILYAIPQGFVSDFIFLGLVLFSTNLNYGL
jgi:hypothetical protein